MDCEIPSVRTSVGWYLPGTTSHPNSLHLQKCEDLVQLAGLNDQGLQEMRG